ncbi:hypothetical protein GBA52_015995 [Prunus armeniaca]|nr:hypothetical protein GBA52_015995 [Prunus armeniaca]
MFQEVEFLRRTKMKCRFHHLQQVRLGGKVLGMTILFILTRIRHQTTEPLWKKICSCVCSKRNLCTICSRGQWAEHQVLYHLDIGISLSSRPPSEQNSGVASPAHMKNGSRKHPSKLSEEMVRCMAVVYCWLCNAASVNIGKNKSPLLSRSSNNVINLDMVLEMPQTGLLKVYTASNVRDELEEAKEFIKANVVVKKSRKVFLPKILERFAREVSFGPEDLLKWVTENADKKLNDSIHKC